MKPSTNICESCGEPMHHLSDFGTNLDGTINTEFCRHCFLKGKFVNRGVTLEQKIEKNVAMAEKMRMPKEDVTPSAHTKLPKLRRWKGMKPVEKDI